MLFSWTVFSGAKRLHILAILTINIIRGRYEILISVILEMVFVLKFQLQWKVFRYHDFYSL